MENHLIAAVSVIGNRLEQGRERVGLKDKELAAHAQIDLATLSRWKFGGIPETCRKVSLAGLAVGLTPNELFLDDDIPEVSELFRAEKRERVKASIRLLAKLTGVVDDAPEMLVETLELMWRRCQKPLEEGETGFETPAMPSAGNIASKLKGGRLEPKPPKSSDARSAADPNTSYGEKTI